MEYLLEAESIHKSFFYPLKVDLLKGISLKVKPQETIAIMGRSGEGKSTLLHILGTLDEPTSGTLHIASQKVEKRKAPFFRNHHIGFIFQAFHLMEEATVLQNVLLPALIAGKSVDKESETYERAFFLLQKVGLTHRAHYAAKLLSGGERQRVSIARAFCNDPALILADEPTGNLDQATSGAIHDLLFKTAESLQKGLIIVTHSQELASLCQKTFQLSDGKLNT